MLAGELAIAASIVTAENRFVPSGRTSQIIVRPSDLAARIAAVSSRCVMPNRCLTGTRIEGRGHSLAGGEGGGG